MRWVGFLPILNSMKLELLPMTAPTGSDYEALLNDPRTTKHMPLHSGYMSAHECEAWAKMKADQWGPDSSLGPWSVYIDSKFAGWGGFQPEDNDTAGAALVLHSIFWGFGKEIFEAMRRRFRENGATQPIIVMLAKSRSASGLANRLGFTHVGEIEEAGALFDLFTLDERA